MSSFLFVLGLPFYALAVYLLLNVLYLLVFALAGHLPGKPLPAVPAGAVPRRLGVLMPAYRADDVILQTAPAAARHQYVGDFQVYVIADGLQPATVQTLRAQGIAVVEVAFERSTKGKALLAALTTLPATACDVAVILDVDNEMAPGFLNQVNQAFAAGYRVVQGHRTAHTLDSAFAVLDACSEEINNHIFRLGHARLGMSPALIGSGMAFEFEHLRHLLQDIGESAGEDKELDFRVLRQGVKIAYLPDGLVLDEKIASAASFGTQRTRWLAAQRDVLVKYFVEGFQQLARGNVEFFDKTLQAMLVPRVLLLGGLGLLAPLMLLLPRIGPPAWVWPALLAGTALALLLSLPRRLYNGQVAQAVLHLPVAVVKMTMALLQMKKAKASFLPTPHAARPGNVVTPS